MKQVDWTNSHYEAVVKLLNVRTGLTFRPDQRDSTEAGIQRALERSRAGSLGEFVDWLEFDVQALDNLVVELTVGETYFFREPRHFEAIREQILPEIRRRRGREHTIGIWSAACASGEEPYSLAILCEQEGLAKQTHILATDISSEALAKAREATYRTWSLRGEHAATARNYLTLKDDLYHLNEPIARRVQFEFLNLALDMYPSYETGTMGLDLILCRNVLIYFDAETIKGVARRLHGSLSEGGWLVTASGDPSLMDHADFEPLVTEYGVFYRRPMAAEKVVASKSLEPRIPSVERRRQPLSTAAVAVAKPTPATHQRVPATEQIDSLAAAKSALTDGHYTRVLELTENRLSDPAACVLHIKALANIDAQQAVVMCERFVELHPLSPDLQYLSAVLLMEQNLDVEAVQAAQRTVFLDRSLAAAHFLLGSILRQRGSAQAAQRSFRNARNLCESRPPGEIVALCDSETASQLLQAAESQLATIASMLES